MKKLLFATFVILPLVSACSSNHEESGKEEKKHEMGHTEEHAKDHDHAKEHDHADDKGHAEVHWGYEGAGGPEHWGDLKPEFATCKDGKSQSPIDIETSKVVKAELPAIEFHYQEAPLSVVNNGHTIKVNYPAGSSIKVGEVTYELLQFHFHTPSEHTIDGKPFAMVAHLVHKSADGGLGVVGVLMKEGASNPAIETIWKVMPKQAGEKVESSEITINASAILPENHSYYNYSGSLTTPPCTEGVNWMVLQTPIEVSKEQVAALAALFKNNARPVQPLNGREVKAN